MSIKNFGGIVHIGTYNDHHKEATFHVPPGTNTADLIRAFMSESAEDVSFSSVSPESNSGSLYPFVVPAILAELNLYSMVEFEKMYRAAAAKEAPDLAQFLKQYKQLGVLDFGRLNKKQIFETLQAFFPNEIHYLYNNFIYYF